MTAIIGYKHGDQVYIGADSYFGNDYQKWLSCENKVFQVNEIVMSQCGSVRAHNILKYNLSNYLLSNGNTSLEYCAYEDFPRAVRQCLKDGGVVEINNGVEKVSDGLGIVFTVGKELFLMLSDFDVMKIVDGIATTGSGAEVCRGAMYAFKETGIYRDNPIAMILKSLQIAAECDPGVSAPFTIMDDAGIEIPLEGK
jgi:ATP-dependent protease HslVU (ClpYQ) peptidase subunit